MIYLISLLSVFAFSIEGQFLVSGEYELIQERRTEVLDARFSSHRKKMMELKAQGYNCSRVVGNYKCVLFVKNPSLPKSIEVIPKREVIAFGPILGKEIVADGDDFLQYSTDQEITIDGVVYKGALYTERSIIKKVKVGTESDLDPVYFVIEDDLIYELQFYKKSQGRFAWTDYIVEVNYAVLQ